MYLGNGPQSWQICTLSPGLAWLGGVLLLAWGRPHHHRTESAIEHAQWFLLAFWWSNQQSCKQQLVMESLKQWHHHQSPSLIVVYIIAWQWHYPWGLVYFYGTMVGCLYLGKWFGIDSDGLQTESIALDLGYPFEEGVPKLVAFINHCGIRGAYYC